MGFKKKSTVVKAHKVDNMYHYLDPPCPVPPLCCDWFCHQVLSLSCHLSLWVGYVVDLVFTNCEGTVARQYICN